MHSTPIYFPSSDLRRKDETSSAHFPYCEEKDEDTWVNVFFDVGEEQLQGILNLSSGFQKIPEFSSTQK